MLVMSVPMPSYAVIGAGDTVVVVGDVSPTGIMNNVNHTMERLKNFVLDRLATLIAKQILHQLTMSVVNWINSGFKGSPAFLTNPEGFFLDVADQVTGAYLATDGPLSSLCSPFSIDIRLKLALSQAALTDQRYTCTLSQIIKAQSGGPTVTVNGKTVLAANSITGFTGGDFNQGGWPAFVTMTTESQNNPYGAFLSAQSDLYATIGSKQNTIHADLSLGQGFMSWESCKDIPGGSKIDLNDEAGIEKSKSFANDKGSKQVQNKDGTVTYQQCETQTPGSVIAGTLQTNLNVPVVELELANDINAIVNALVTQMVSTMLSSGLHALSGGSSGGGTSYTQQVINDANSNTAAQASLGDLKANIGPAIDSINSYLSLYDQAITLLNDSRTRYETARSCFANQLAGNLSLTQTRRQQFQTNITNIDNTINTSIVSSLNNMNDKYANGVADRTQLEDITYAISGTGSAAEVQAQAQKYSDFVQAGGLNMQSKIDAAQTALTTAQLQSKTYNEDAAQLLKDCNNAGGVI